MRQKLSVNGLFSVLFVLIVQMSFGQQDPQYTQYMYNTMSINPGYAGSKGHLTLNGLARTQWVGIEGAPNTQTLSFHLPIGHSGIGLGLNLINDELGPARETYFDANISYTIPTSEEGRLAFGLKLGGRLFDVDWSKGRLQDQDAVFNQNINSKFLPTIGVGLYYYTEKFYFGVSIPNFLGSEHYKDLSESLARERLHYFLIGGYVFNVTENLKFKPAFLVKAVPGAPLIADLSANALFNDTFSLGLGYRWDDSVSALLGFQITKSLNIGYAYDLTTSGLKNYNSGSHEVMLRLDILKESLKLKSPRFF